MSVGRRRVWWVVGGTALVVAVVVVAFVALGGSSKATAKVAATSKVVRGTVTTSVSAEGTVQAQASRTLGFSSTGTLTELDVKAGDNVAPGATLAKIDPTTAQNAVNTASTAVSDAQTAVDNANTELTTANAGTCPTTTGGGGGTGGTGGQGGTHTASLTTSPSPSATPSASPSASPRPSATATATPGSGGHSGGATGGATGGSTGGGANSGGANSCTAATLAAKKQQASDSLFSAQQRLNNAQLTLQQAQTKLDGTVLTAPIAGKVLSVSGSLGASAGSSFLVLAGTDDVSVKAQFTEAEVAKLTLKQVAKITLPDKVGTTFTGTVIQIDPAGTTSGRLVRYTALIAFDKAPADLLYGQSADVAVVTASANNVLSVPATAVYDRNGTTGTVDLKVAGKVEKRAVTIGLRGDVDTEITSGLSLGDEVLTSPAT